jgi:hypothetical protein
MKESRKNNYRCPMGWMVNKYGKRKVTYLLENITPNNEWLEMMEEYGKYVEQKMSRQMKISGEIVDCEIDDNGVRVIKKFNLRSVSL